MENALIAAVENQVSFELFEEGLREVRSQDVDTWVHILAEYEKDSRNKNPYESPIPSQLPLLPHRTVLIPTLEVSLAKVRLRYATEEADLAAGGILAAHETSASAFILAGFEIEDMQCVCLFLTPVSCTNASSRRLMLFNKSNGITTSQATLTQDRRLGFFRKLTNYRVLRDAYMPGIINEGLAIETAAEIPIHSIPLQLPSSVLPADRARTCQAYLFAVEADLRYGQAHDALEEVRRHLRTRTSTNRFKIKNITGQRANTRARTLQKSIDKRIKISTAKYRCARAAHLALIGPGVWESVLQALEPADVRALNERSLTTHEEEESRRLRLRTRLPNENDEFTIDETTTGGPGEGFRTLSWIWLRPTGSQEEEAEIHEG